MAGNVVSNVKKYYGGQVPVPDQGDSDGKVKVLVEKTATIEIGGVQTEVELLYDADDLTTPVTPQQLGQWTDENYLIAFKKREDDGRVRGFILYALETDSTSTDTLVNRAEFISFKEDMAHEPGASAYEFTMIEDSSTLARYLRDENGELIVKFDKASVEDGAQSDTLDNLIGSDSEYMRFEVVREGDNAYLNLNTESLDEEIEDIQEDINYLVGAIAELPSDEHGYFNSSLYNTPGDGTTTNLVIDDFRIAEGRDVSGENIEFVPTHQEGGVDFGNVYLEPGTYILAIQYTLQWVGNPRGTFLPKVCSVADQPFDFSYEHEDVIRVTRIVTKTTRGKLVTNIAIDADTPSMGVWVKNLEIAQIASYNHPAVAHDTTLTGTGKLDSPLGVTPAAFGKVKDIPTSISQFRTGDVIPVDGPNGPAKMAGQTIVDTINGLDYSVLKKIDEAIKNAVEFGVGETLTPTATYTNKVLNKDGTLSDSTLYDVNEYNVAERDYCLFLSGRSPGGITCLAVALDANSNVIAPILVAQTENYVDKRVLIPAGTTKLYVNGGKVGGLFQVLAVAKKAEFMHGGILTTRTIDFTSRTEIYTQPFSVDFQKGSFYKVSVTVDDNCIGYVSYFAAAVKVNMNMNTFLNYTNCKYGQTKIDLYFIADGNEKYVSGTVLFSQACSGTVTITVEQVSENTKEYIDYVTVRPLIFDTDFDWDIDDTFATRILAWGISTGKVDLVSVLISEKCTKSVSAMDGLLCEEGIGPAAIGLTNQINGFNFNYLSILENYPNHRLTNNNDARNIVSVWRVALLHVSPLNKCDIVITGPLNNLNELINTAATTDFPSGIDLLKSRVRKIFVMGGSHNAGQQEYNFKTDPQATYNVLENCPVPMYFQDHEFAAEPTRITEGANLGDELGDDDYLYRAYVEWLSNSGASVSTAYDPLVMLAAIEDNEYLSGLYYVRGHINFDVATKTQTFIESSDGNHYMAYKTFPNYLNYYKHRLDNIYFKRPFGCHRATIHRIVP